MRLPVIGLFLFVLALTANAKPAPDAETFRFIAACGRQYAWGADDARIAQMDRDMKRSPNARERKEYFAARARLDASRAYLRRLSSRTFRRRLDDALYLTTLRSPFRCAVAYSAAIRGVDTVVNCRRMNDTLREKYQLLPSPEWEVQLVHRLNTEGCPTVNPFNVPVRLIDVYRHHPDELILRLIYEYPVGLDGEAAMIMQSALSTAAGVNAKGMLRIAAGNERRMRLLMWGLSGDCSDQAARPRAKRSFRSISRSRGSLAAPARRCLESMERWDASLKKNRS